MRCETCCRRVVPEGDCWTITSSVDDRFEGMWMRSVLQWLVVSGTECEEGHLGTIYGCRIWGNGDLWLTGV